MKKSITVLERYETLLTAMQERQDKVNPKPIKRKILPKDRQAYRLQKDLLVLAAQKLADNPSSAAKRVLLLCAEAVMYTATYKLYGPALRRRRSA